MSPSGNEESQDNISLAAAVEANDSQTLQQLIQSRDFTLLQSEDESDEEGSAALMAECDGSPVLIAFSNMETAGVFVDAMSEEFGGQEVPAFVVDGKSLLENLPEGLGILLDPETDQCCVIPPDAIG